MAYAGSRPRGRPLENPTTPRTGHVSGFRANSLPGRNCRRVADGGPTQTIALRRGSPTLNAIPEDGNGCGTEITEDRRGVKGPHGKGCDIGAYEKK